MMEATINRHALESALSGMAAGAGQGIDHLSVARAPSIALVMAASGQEGTVEAALRAEPDLSVRFSSPGEWIVVASGGALAADLSHRLGDTAFVVDQSDGRVLLTLSGPNGRAILAKGTGRDLHADAFAIGDASNVLLGHVSVNLARTGEDRFELIAMRSFALSLFDDLLVMGRQFALTAGFAD